ncbi:site-specific integrase [Mycobacterium alsense]|uniref:Site-specific integrase n=1 Tax=Mycobacterium alsense TaxID=324058 RepID=A0AA42C0F1_9MYCO|nr:site-specific integrase [Mycobacterium alsense]MCV7381461.1 site-specific integrase [Mycobacterium alsense]OQZ89521.1 site-specific integrase [Mycobacterium alsense]
MTTAERKQRRSFGRLRQFRSGRWKASYTGPDGMLYEAPTTFALKQDGEAWLTDRRREIDRNLWSPSSGQDDRPNALFADYADEWLKRRTVKGRPLKDRTRAHYEALLDQHINPTFGHVTTRAINPDAVRKWYATCAIGAPVIRAHAYSLLSTILGTAASEGIADTNPCTISGAGNTERRLKIRPATLSELETIATEMPERLRLMVLLAAWAALRFGELAELRRKDIVGNVIQIRRGVVRVDGEMRITTPKSTAGSRDVTIPPHLMPFVEQHLERHTGAGRESLLFPAINGGHLQPSSLYRYFYPARDKAKRPDLRFHDLRHTGATLAAQTGATLAELMGRLGHSTVSAALKYQHIAADRDAQIADALSKIALGEKELD